METALIHLPFTIYYSPFSSYAPSRSRHDAGDLTRQPRDGLEHGDAAPFDPRRAARRPAPRRRDRHRPRLRHRLPPPRDGEDRREPSLPDDRGLPGWGPP